MKIVRMEKRHIPALVRLEAVCFSTPWTEAGLEAELSKDTAVFFVAEREETGEVLGYAGDGVAARNELHDLCLARR